MRVLKKEISFEKVGLGRGGRIPRLDSVEMVRNAPKLEERKKGGKRRRQRVQVKLRKTRGICRERRNGGEEKGREEQEEEEGEKGEEREQKRRKR